MPAYVALLRSVNVAGHGRVGMADLVQTFESLRYKDISTYIQTGNVLFTASSKSPAKLSGEIELQLAADFGAAPAVIIRTVPELQRVGRASPYAKAGADPARHHVTFLAEAPTKERLQALKIPKSGRDELVIDGREIYVHTPDGYGNTKLTGAFLERHLAVVSTTRNWNTVTKLCELAAG